MTPCALRSCSKYIPHVSAIQLIKVFRACCTSFRRPIPTAAHASTSTQYLQLRRLRRCNSNDEVTTDADDIAMALPHVQCANDSLVNRKEVPAARGTPKALYQSERRKFSLILRNIILHRCSATTESDRTDFTRATSAAKTPDVQDTMVNVVRVRRTAVIDVRVIRTSSVNKTVPCGSSITTRSPDEHAMIEVPPDNDRSNTSP